ncbi:MAG: TolC family protein [Planctomycetes bacterium]|nr:TolC family protein [Planctomycetota bacterium]
MIAFSRSPAMRRAAIATAAGACLLAGCVGNRLSPGDRALVERYAEAGAAARAADPALETDPTTPPGAAASPAPTAPEDELSRQDVPLALPALVARVLGRNPEREAAEARVAAAKARIPQASAQPDPRVGVEFDDVPASTSDPTRGQREGFVSRELVLPPKLSLRADVAELEATVAEQNLTAKERDLVAEVKRAFHELYGAERAIAIQREQVALLEQIAKVADVKYQNGKGRQTEVLKAQVEVAQLQSDLLVFERERTVARLALNRALSRPPSAPLGPAPTTLPDVAAQGVERLRRLALQRRPELRSAWAELSKSVKARELAEKERWLPDLGLELRWMSDPREDLEDRWMAGVSFNVPWFNPKWTYALQEARASAAAARSEVLATRNRTLGEVEEAFVKVETARRLADLFRQSILPPAEQALESARKAYETDLVDFLTFVDSERMVRGLKLAFHRTLADLGMRLAELERAVGSELGE